MVYGHVHGVFFRARTKEQAQNLHLAGFVRNTQNAVEIVVEGEKDKIEKLLEWCKTGPVHAEVERTDVKWTAYKGEFRRFEIRY